MPRRRTGPFNSREAVQTADVPRNRDGHAPIDAVEVTEWVRTTEEFVADSLATLGLRKLGIDIEKSSLEE